MINVEKVIKGLEICINRVPGKYNCNECPYKPDGNCCEINLTNDAISMLKEHEAERLDFIETVAKLVAENESLKTTEIIRCKDCRFRQSRVSRIIEGKEWNLCEIVKDYKPADWFCADGEKKGEFNEDV